MCVLCVCVCVCVCPKAAVLWQHGLRGSTYGANCEREHARLSAPPSQSHTICEPFISPQTAYPHRRTISLPPLHDNHAATFHTTFTTTGAHSPLGQGKSLCSRIAGRSERALEFGAESLLCLLLLTLQMARRLWECVAVTKWGSSRMSVAGYVVRVCAVATCFD